LNEVCSFLYTFSDTEFQLDEQIQLKFSIERVNKTLGAIVPIYGALLKAANAPPPPSLYAQHPVWGEWQQKETAILCLRPSDKQGLSLSVLHDIFRQFQVHARTSISSDGPHAAAAIRAAFCLCEQMGDSFVNEKARTKAFDSCVKSLFPESVWHHQRLMEAETESYFGYFDASYWSEGILRIVREDKIEPGDGGDSYMQTARDYQLYISSLREKRDPFLMQGAPTFLLCVFGILPLPLSGLHFLSHTVKGPIFVVAGGFYDGISHIVEPLVAPCLMLPDQLDIRQQALASQLLALKKALDSLATFVSC